MTEEAIPTDLEEFLQAGLDALNAQSPPTYNPLAYQANFRHLCTKARQAQMTGKGVSTAIDLKERYVTNWDYTNGVAPVENADDADYAILYREGKCKSCKEIARSKVGRIVRTADRPPVHGRVGRE